jgi:hypothetical protein
MFFSLSREVDKLKTLCYLDQRISSVRTRTTRHLRRSGMGQQTAAVASPGTELSWGQVSWFLWIWRPGRRDPSRAAIESRRRPIGRCRSGRRRTWRTAATANALRLIGRACYARRRRFFLGDEKWLEHLPISSSFRVNKCSHAAELARQFCAPLSPLVSPKTNRPAHSISHPLLPALVRSRTTGTRHPLNSPARRLLARWARHGSCSSPRYGRPRPIIGWQTQLKLQSYPPCELHWPAIKLMATDAAADN